VQPELGSGEFKEDALLSAREFLDPGYRTLG
jgi:hypothetical protein